MGGLLMDTCELCGKREDERNTQQQMGYTICLGCDGLHSDEEIQELMTNPPIDLEEIIKNG